MTKLQINPNRIYGFIEKGTIKSLQAEIDICFDQLVQKTGKGNDFLGWLTLPTETLQSELVNRIQQEALKLKQISELVVVVGIGGSYLGARAVIESLSNNFHSFIKSEFPEIIYAGQNISEEYTADLMQLLDKKEYSIIVISKSGTTTEPALAFRLLKKHLENKYGKEKAREHIVAITDKEKGALKKLSDVEKYSTYTIPDDVGGRYSVLTPVGLLPIAVAGFDIEKLLQGAAHMQEELYKTSDMEQNPACMYAAIRNSLYRAGKPVEILVNYQPNLIYISEWWKQLFGESEGKDHKGIFTASVNFSTDLHSLGQYIQDGLRVIFETMLQIEKPNRTMAVPFEENDSDGLNFIAGKPIHEVNKMAALGTTIAHNDGGVPVLHLTLPELNEYTLGELIYFFEFACGISGYMLDVNPFDQPGVEAYKNNMFALLGKPGYEEKRSEILKKFI
jgi:glucose-6-phosphate isomerase